MIADYELNYQQLAQNIAMGHGSLPNPSAWFLHVKAIETPPVPQSTQSAEPQRPRRVRHTGRRGRTAPSAK